MLARSSAGNHKPYRSIEKEAKDIEQMQEHSRVRQIFEAPQNQEDVIKRYRRIESLFRQLQVSPTVHIQSQV